MRFFDHAYPEEEPQQASTTSTSLDTLTPLQLISPVQSLIPILPLHLPSRISHPREPISLNVPQRLIRGDGLPELRRIIFGRTRTTSLGGKVYLIRLCCGTHNLDMPRLTISIAEVHVRHTRTPHVPLHIKTSAHPTSHTSTHTV